jgi:hypothetical protein
MPTRPPIWRDAGRQRQPAAESPIAAGSARTKSGRRDSNSRRPAWEASTLPLSYARRSNTSKCILRSRALASDFRRPGLAAESTPEQNERNPTCAASQPETLARFGAMDNSRRRFSSRAELPGLESVRLQQCRESPAEHGPWRECRNGKADGRRRAGDSGASRRATTARGCRTLLSSSKLEEEHSSSLIDANLKISED